MNATPPVLPAFIPDAGVAASATASQSPFASANGPSFASTLKDLGAKTSRKPAVAKRSSGESMPQAGNASPAAPVSRTTTSSASRSTASAKPATAATLDAAACAAGPTSDEQSANPSLASSTPQPATVVPFGTSAVQPADAADVPASGADPTAAAGAAAPPGAAGATAPGKSTAPPGSTRPGVALKAALQHPAAALNASDASDADDSTDTTTTATAAPAAALAASVDTAWTAPPSVDGTTAAALAAFAGSRNAYAAAAGDAGNAADDPAAAVTGVSGVVVAASSESALNAPAAQAQSALLSDVARLDKHASASVDAAPVNGTADVAAGLSQLGSTAGAAPETASTPTLRVAANVDSADFPQDLSARVAWMVDNNLNGAKLQVNPPQLGPIELRILVNGEHAQVWMSTHSAVTRAALESSAPILREMLGSQGFSQVSVDISQRSFQERSAYSQQYEGTATGRGASVAAASRASDTPTQNSQGILDAYA